jgi:glycosyltransferase involved in cell wall biosynthesis
VTLVSVIVPTRDRPELLAEALASVRAVEGGDLRLEIVVGDNSASSTAEATAQRFAAKYVAVAERGAAAARNAALHAATGDFIAFLDDDDLWLPAHIRPHLRLLAEQPMFGAVIGQVVNTDATGASRGPAWPTRFPSKIGATVVRAEVARAVGDFDPRLIGDQDWDWHLRLAALTRIGFVPEPMVLFRHRPLGSDTRLSWMRLGFTTRVMWRNILRMPRAVRLSTLRAFISHRGQYSLGFRAAARVHYAAGDIPLARMAIAYSFLASPLHFIVSLARDPSAVPWMWHLISG